MKICPYCVNKIKNTECSGCGYVIKETRKVIKEEENKCDWTDFIWLTFFTALGFAGIAIIIIFGA